MGSYVPVREMILLPLCPFWVECSVSQAHKAWSQSFLFKDFLKISTAQISSKSCAIPLQNPGVDWEDGGGRGSTSRMPADKCIISLQGGHIF